MQIKTVVDELRGCGWRKEGGLYLIGGFSSAPCRKLPLPLSRCPCCDSGIKPSRGWTWIKPQPFAEMAKCENKSCSLCPLGERCPDRAGLLWVGEKFYPTPASFTAEAARLGVSRRISQIPRDFKLGQTWVFFAHRLALKYAETDFALAFDESGERQRAGIFHAFLPTEIQYVVTGSESEEQLRSLVDRGITPVKIEV